MSVNSHDNSEKKNLVMIALSIQVRSDIEYQYILQKIPEIISVETVTEIR